MPINTGISTNGLRESGRSKIIILSTAVLAIFFVTFIVWRAYASQNETTANTLSKVQTFDVAIKTEASITDESANVFTKGTTWGLQNYSLGYSDKAQRDAANEAARIAAAHASALSAAAINSYTSVANYSTAREIPGGIPTSPAPLAPGNAYAPGYCTWYAYNRRYQIGRPVPNMLGNGGAWHLNAPRFGLPADHTPEVGAVMDMAGHVAVVEAIGDNNTVFVSEMNYGGLYRYNTRWVANASRYWYVH